MHQVIFSRTREKMTSTNICEKTVCVCDIFYISVRLLSDLEFQPCMYVPRAAVLIYAYYACPPTTRSYLFQKCGSSAYYYS